jgi:alanyl-tRNA synthetase
MHTSNIRTRFLEFFQKREHVIIPSASLVTSDEKSVTNPTLFNTAGMQPLVPYLLGKPYMIGNKEIRRLVNIQKCLRTVDIDEVGDKKHATFFEMMGNWSLGDYSKKETIGWSYEFLTSREEGLGLDPNRLYVTVFEGDNNAPRDNEVADIWQHIFKTNNVKDGEGDTTSEKVGKIFFMPKDNNWWEAGDDGPCGPDTEMYYDVSNKFKGGGITKKQFSEADSAGDIIEVWNDVFMQYEKKNGKITGKLTRLSVDTGAGLERLAMIMQNSDTIYDTDLFRDAMEFIKGHSDNWELRPARIIADHVRASTFLIASGISPANTGRGYILRRLIRRAVRYADILNMSEEK